MLSPATYPMVDRTQVGAASRAAQALARGLGFDEARAGQAAIVVSEAAENLAEHAREGEIVLRAHQDDGVPALDVLALDRGPGMDDVRRCLEDGYSTRGGPGTGLGAIARLATELDIHSVPGAGTVLFARLRGGRAPASARSGPRRSELGVLALPLPGESVSGDAFAVLDDGPYLRVCLADGLGHGPEAALAAVRATGVFREIGRSLPPAEVLAAAHEALRPTRGAAVLIATIDRGRRTVRYAGLGNVAGRTIAPDGATHGLLSHEGTVGFAAERVQELEVTIPAGGVLVLHTDGLKSRWDIGTGGPAVLARNPCVLAGLLYRDHARRTDDVTVLVIRSMTP